MNGPRTRRLVLFTASAALAVGTVCVSSSAFATPRAAGALTASTYTSDDSSDPESSGSGQGTDTSDNDRGNATGGDGDAEYNSPNGNATGGDGVGRPIKSIKSIKRTWRSDHPTAHIGDAPARQRSYTTKSSPAVHASKVVLWY
ncbi:hypothetical protein [Streptomyces yangpuensis]|uniref:hypothetical protein n=1 Tax=Streptomyces yangpuensis TaxID=1648182 RepID=UPI00371025CE